MMTEGCGGSGLSGGGAMTSEIVAPGMLGGTGFSGLRTAGTGANGAWIETAGIADVFGASSYWGGIRDASPGGCCWPAHSAGGTTCTRELDRERLLFADVEAGGAAARVWFTRGCLGSFSLAVCSRRSFRVERRSRSASRTAPFAVLTGFFSCFVFIVAVAQLRNKSTGSLLASASLTLPRSLLEFLLKIELFLLLLQIVKLNTGAEIASGQRIGDLAPLLREFQVSLLENSDLLV